VKENSRFFALVVCAITAAFIPGWEVFGCVVVVLVIGPASLSSTFQLLVLAGGCVCVCPLWIGRVQASE